MAHYWRAAAASQDARAKSKIWDVEKREAVRTIEGHALHLRSAFSARRKNAGDISYDKFISYGRGTGKEIRTPRTHRRDLRPGIHADGKRLLSAAADRHGEGLDTATASANTR